MAPSSSSSAYSYKPGGSLKFKGGDAPSGSKKKQKKSRSSTSNANRKGEGSSRSHGLADDSTALTQANQGSDKDDVHVDDNDGQGSTGRAMTEAEEKFDQIRKKRLAERVLKQAKLSHKDRVDAFNRDLESRTEHFEMGRVGGGG